ncbi:hypothetical protein C8R43DRAFT_959453 [Mycena crocata]|nr:hypothetical protein C8R43DRAFT_959453 [Mycena crocata]
MVLSLCLPFLLAFVLATPARLDTREQKLQKENPCTVGRTAFNLMFGNLGSSLAAPAVRSALASFPGLAPSATELEEYLTFREELIGRGVWQALPCQRRRQYDDEKELEKDDHCAGSLLHGIATALAAAARRAREDWKLLLQQDAANYYQRTRPREDKRIKLYRPVPFLIGWHIGAVHCGKNVHYLQNSQSCMSTNPKHRLPVESQKDQLRRCVTQAKGERQVGCVAVENLYLIARIRTMRKSWPLRARLPQSSKIEGIRFSTRRVIADERNAHLETDCPHGGWNDVGGEANAEDAG